MEPSTSYHHQGEGNASETTSRSCMAVVAEGITVTNLTRLVLTCR